MNKVCLILLFPVLILNASFAEVFKLPQLVSHFMAHQELNTEIGVWDFLEMHYFGKDINDNDQEEDMKLPFKKIDGHQMFSLGVPQGRVLLLNAASQKISSNQVFKYQFFIPASYTSSLLRPPIS